ncbi:MAG: SIS domain-containing protein [Candidatus Omnitrophica bacterium]|nr:SIS domain-containing protein [Candidatus Omnitrophota bacterium]
MNNIDRMVEELKDFKQFARGYLQYLSDLFQRLDMDALEKFLKELEDARKSGKTVFIIGNGGSAGTASHMANDFGFGLRSHPQTPFKVMSLTDNVPVISALANDVGYEQIFLRQLQLYAKPGDKLIVITASGNSPNLLSASRWFKQYGGKVLGLLGFDGGQMLGLCDAAVVVKTPKGEYGPVEDIHMILDHLLYSWLWSKERRQSMMTGGMI